MRAPERETPRFRTNWQQPAPTEKFTASGASACCLPFVVQVVNVVNVANVVERDATPGVEMSYLKLLRQGRASQRLRSSPRRSGTGLLARARIQRGDLKRTMRQ